MTAVASVPGVLSLDLSKNEKSEWTASMGIPSGNATGLVVQDIVVIGSSVTFTGVELMMAKFDLTLGPDGKMKGTMANARMSQPIEFTLEMGAGSVPLNDVKQAGRKVAFGLKVAHGSFEGTLNEDGTELTGKFNHEGETAPLMLRKK